MSKVIWQSVPKETDVIISTRRLCVPAFNQWARIFVEGSKVGELVNEVPRFSLPSLKKTWKLEIEPYWTTDGGGGLSTWRYYVVSEDRHWNIVCDDGWMDGVPDLLIEVRLETLLASFKGDAATPEQRSARSELIVG